MFSTNLESTKAFDRVNYVKLFKLLVHGMLPPVSVRLLLNTYTCHVCRVLVWTLLGSLFCFKQGVIISPVLFFIYFDELLDKLAEAGVGCYIGNIFVGAFAYADDIVLLAPTTTAMRLMFGICDNYALEYSILTAMRLMLGMCDNYALEYSILFNAKKI